MTWTTDPTTASEISAAVAASADQITQLNALRTALGAGPWPLTIKRADSGSAWPSGTTVYNGTVGGSLQIVDGKLILGEMSAVSTAAPFNLSVGTTAARLFSSSLSRYVEMSVGLDGSSADWTLRKSPSGTYGLPLFGTIEADLDLAPSPVVELHRRVLENTSGGTQSSGFVTQTFGEFFEQGDVPAETYPQWRTATGDLLCPATTYNQVFWDDGSLRWCGVMLAVPQSITAGGSIEVVVKSGGRAPTLSSRTLSDVSSLDLNVLVGGVTNLTGNWTSSVNTGAATPSKVVKVADGAAGAIFRVQEDFLQSGSPHGQLVCTHYVEILQNAAGGHAGTRYLGRIGLPFCDVGPGLDYPSGPAPIGMTVTVGLRSGTTVVRQVQGMTTTSVRSDNILLPHYGSIATCGPAAQYDFFPGIQTTETLCRVKPAPVAAIRSRLVPPYDLTLTPSSRGGTNQDGSSREYYGHWRGTMLYSTGTTGEREEIGLMPSWIAAYIIGDVANSEKEMRANAMCTTGWAIGARRKSTGMPVPTAGFTTPYTGLGSTQAAWRFGYASSGFGFPTSNTKLWSGEGDAHHRGGVVYGAYLFTAEPQYLDLLVEQAANFVSVLPQGSGTTWTTAQPQTTAYTGAFHSRDQQFDGVSYPAAGIIFRADIERYAAWMLRDITQAAAIYPTICPQGTQIKKYLRDVVDSNYAAWVKYRSLMPQSYRDNGLMLLKAAHEKGDEPWAMGYLANVYAHARGLLGTANTLECAQHLANYWISIQNDPNIDLAHGFAYVATVYDENGHRIMSVDDQFYMIQYCDAQYSAETNSITFVAAPSGTLNFGFANGDQLRITDNGPFVTSDLVSGAPERTILYIINKSGYTFQVSLTPGGPPATILQTRSVYAPYVRIVNFAPEVTVERATGSSSYLANIRGAVRHMKAIGCTGLDPVVTDCDARIITAGTSFTGDPKNALASALPSEV